MINKRCMIFLSAIFWFAAGINVLRMGVDAYPGKVTGLISLETAALFIPFFIMFQRIATKNTRRIMSMNREKDIFLKFFTLKTYLLVILMMTLGIVLRNNSAVSSIFIAFLYTAIGSALILSSLRYLWNVIRWEWAKRRYGYEDQNV